MTEPTNLREIFSNNSLAKATENYTTPERAQYQRPPRGTARCSLRISREDVFCFICRGTDRPRRFVEDNELGAWAKHSQQGDHRGGGTARRPAKYGVSDDSLLV